MRIRFLSIRAFVPTAVLLSAMTLAVSPSFSQQAQAPGPSSGPSTGAGQAAGGGAPSGGKSDVIDAEVVDEGKQ